MAAIENDVVKNKVDFDVEKIRGDFPLLKEKINGKNLIYFDNAATNQKPQVVIDALIHYYSSMNANIHRGIHTLAEKATAAFEQTRETVRQFINAPSAEEIFFTSGTTHGINLVASTYGRQHVKKGDVILISALEHHSNMVPWQMLAAEKEAVLKVIPINNKGEIILEEYEKLLHDNVKIVAVNHVSNTLGTINPVKRIIEQAHQVKAKVLIDGAQAVSHLTVDVIDMDADFYAFSSHKLYGPTGVGILYGKRELLESMPPYQGGGEMIREVSYEGYSYNDLPYKFEAGTPNIADVIALREAINYLNKIGKTTVNAYEHVLLEYATEKLSAIHGLQIIGTANEKVSVISFVIDGIHHQDIGILLDQEGIAVRTGHHCTQPLMGKFKIAGTTRASFAMYNTMEEIDALVKGIYKVIKMFK
jgi:cysteine desulfurase/selenocysteine lyase